MRLSARGYHLILRVARTLADLDIVQGGGNVNALTARIHIAEALSYRREQIGRDGIKQRA